MIQDLGQIAWVGGNVTGHSIDPITNKIDSTEGFGAFDSIFNIPYALKGRAIDIGGGSHDANCAYVATRYLVDCVVYDPFMRNETHNQNVLKMASAKPFDIVFSISVLNVISSFRSRIDHIKLCLKSLKFNGKAVFKVWPGDGLKEGKETSSGYQSNRQIESYFDEIISVFGRNRVYFDRIEKAIICFNEQESYAKGSISL